MGTLLISGGIVLAIAIFTWIIFNKLVAAKNIVEEAYSGIDVQLKKRFELIPNLIETVKGYNAHEAELLKKIVETRSGTSTISEVASTDATITQSLKNFRIQIEAYPDLKANIQFLKLMDNLSVIENELAMARRYYNGTARDYNTKMEVFPSLLIAKPFGFKNVPFYELPTQAQGEAPVVELNND